MAGKYLREKGRKIFREKGRKIFKEKCRKIFTEKDRQLSGNMKVKIQIKKLALGIRLGKGLGNRRLKNQ